MTGTTVVLTLLFTDIEGSTLMWEQDSKKMEAAVAIHFELLERAITDHHGSVVKKTGDGVFATFNDPLESVRWWPWRSASSPQRTGLGTRSECGWGCTGSCSARDGDHYGRAVNKAAWVEQSAYGGQVLLSGTTAALVRDDLDEGVSLVYVGEHYFDGIIDPEQLYQLSFSGLNNEHPPLRTWDVGLEQLPLERSGLVGRADVTPLLEQELGRRRVVSLVGPPGVGKSRLALRVATEVARERDNGVRFIDLAPCRRIDAAAGTIATGLGVNVREESMVVEGIIRALRSTDILVVLDNCEHLLPAVAPVVDAVISLSPGDRPDDVRERLGVESEFVWPVRPLPWRPRTPPRSPRSWRPRRSSCSSSGRVPSPPSWSSRTVTWSASSRSAGGATACPWPWSSWRPDWSGWHPTSSSPRSTSRSTRSSGRAGASQWGGTGGCGRPWTHRTTRCRNESRQCSTRWPRSRACDGRCDRVRRPGPRCGGPRRARRARRAARCSSSSDPAA